MECCSKYKDRKITTIKQHRPWIRSTELGGGGGGGGGGRGKHRYENWNTSPSKYNLIVNPSNHSPTVNCFYTQRWVCLKVNEYTLKRSNSAIAFLLRIVMEVTFIEKKLLLSKQILSSSSKSRFLHESLREDT